ncbi:cytosol nonspecific dipeptidase [Prevotella sp. P3-120]|uniref:aminoacyl-histidine dipeptidase n=1 Tax=unclassified Prevotella TaxID=2638335 RepID=UPI000B971AA8|nr:MULTISPECIES: aminoacyl-histidine dipeptidase [unclassified Prevotella]OYP48529.1 cytosol nonspecific dipeptidase [Prevotella sp. P3-120]OYP50776.1 cytosol nonspecific dipeptidase [Prevotella sp. P3-92]
MNEITKLDPQCIWKNFYALTQVPRPSGHLEKIQQFLLDFGKQVGVEAFKDPAENIVFRKPATPGMENRKGVILQAHMDMVPQKTPDSPHNFETDAIQPWIDGEWVKATNTTLGADNGLGVAAIMAVMEDKSLVHGPVEALITADEETHMVGVNNLPSGELHGDILLNLDTELWGEFVIGSAGGVDVTATLDYQEVDTDPTDVAVKVTLQGLRGGHSGLEIQEGRGNANKMMVRFVREAIEETEARLASWHGGNMRNAIPFKAEVVLTLPKENVEALKELAADWLTDFQEEYAPIEKNIQLTVEEVATPAKQVPVELQDNLINVIYACHNGVFRMIPHYLDVVETSSNLAIIDIAEGKTAMKILVRSSREDMKENLVKTLESCFNMAGMKVEATGDYAGWDPNPDSEILGLLLKEYKELFGKDGVVQVVHAGLECSVILGKYPHLDVVSLGPTLESPHTTTERALISTVEPFWQLLKKTLADIPEK